MVRIAIAKPAGPTVSCPTMPWRCADRLVAYALLDAADADAREDEVGAARRIRRPSRHSVTRAPSRHPLRDAADGAKARLVRVVERDLFDRQIGVASAR